jgi:predicted phage tail protein
MSDIVVNLPGGRKANFPAGTPPQEIETALAQLEPRVPVSDGMAKSFGQGLTLGTGDEAAAAVRSAMPQFSNWMMRPSAFEQSLGRTGQTVSEAPTFQGRYDEELVKERQALKDFEAQNPNLAMGSEIAGNVVGGVAMSALPGVGALFRGSAGLGANVAKGVAGGALLGGAQGFGQGEGD